jgi:hypothetical protein
VDFNITITNQSIRMGLVCAECQCAPEECTKDINDDDNTIQCKNCIKPLYCCCINLHRQSLRNRNHFNNYVGFSFRSSPSSLSFFSSITIFLKYAKGLYAAALGIEILCIAAAEIGENTGLYLFGFNTLGIAISYVMGYALAGFTTFAAILGRYKYGSNESICSCCCSVLAQDSSSSKGFVSNLKITFANFVVGIKKLPYLYKQRDLKNILKTSLGILITAETACILTAETVDLIFYKYSILLSVPLALLAGAFTVVVPQAYRRTAKKKV